MATRELNIAAAPRAARDGIGIDIVLRRCLAANTACVDSLIDAAEDLPEGVTFQLLRAQTAAFERLAAAVIDEHTRESESLSTGMCLAVSAQGDVTPAAQGFSDSY